MFSLVKKYIAQSEKCLSLRSAVAVVLYKVTEPFRRLCCQLSIRCPGSRLENHTRIFYNRLSECIDDIYDLWFWCLG